MQVSCSGNYLRYDTLILPQREVLFHSLNKLKVIWLFRKKLGEKMEC